MTNSSATRLASEVSVSLLGVGSFLPDRRVSNEKILEYLRPVRPDDRPLEPEWVVRHLGIHERRLDYDFGGANGAEPTAASTTVTWLLERRAPPSPTPESTPPTSTSWSM